MKVSELKNGMLIAPTLGKGWWPIGHLDSSMFPLNASYMKTNNIKNCRLGRDPAIYMGKKIFDDKIHGLYTYHQLLYNGMIYLIDGYEFNGRIDPL